ncbi:MAG TPA: MFS transporter [Thermoanaerobaculia bacterium]|nr:MFS transporter [Thermoanaerobaculia bacterium]
MSDPRRTQSRRLDPDKEAASFGESLRLFRDKRLFVLLVLYISQGYPWVLIGSAMTAWLQESGLTRSAIGLFGVVFTAYTINFVWAPLVDRVRLPLLGRLGQRRSWILAMQGLMALATLAIGSTDPTITVQWPALLALAIAFCGATQDVAIDAYRVELIPREETAMISHGSAIATGGWWTGYGLIGAIPFFIADLEGWSWSRVYLVLAAIWVPLMLFVLFVPEAPQRRDRFKEAEERYERALAGKERPGAWARLTAWLAVTFVEPIGEFFRRTGPQLALSVLLFVFLFKIGEAFLGRMSIVFYKEIGFTDAQIGTYSKLLSWWVTILFAVLSSIVNARFGLIRGLFVGGIAMAASNLMFSWIALVGPHEGLYAAAIVVDGFTSAFSTVAFVAFISFLTSHTYTATQYALLASLGNFGRTALSATSGFMVDALAGNWSLFFVITALMVLPSLALLLFVSRMLKRRVQQWEDEAPVAPGDEPVALE